MKLRITPEIRFFYDTVAENASHIEELIFKALHQNKK
jgi:ribosome-binding factor A